MKRIEHFDSEDFVRYILSMIERHSDPDNPSHNNYSHTHDRVWFDSETGRLAVEEICKNEYGSVFSRNLYGEAYIPVEWSEFLPDSLRTSPGWADF